MGMTPLPHEYMLVGIIGFFISIFMVQNASWSFALATFCLILVIASLISITGDDVDEKTLDLIAGESYQADKRRTIR